VVLSKVSMAHEFLFSRDISCGINVESQSLSRIMFLCLEGHSFGSSNLGENERGYELHLLERVIVGMMHRHWIF